MKSTVDQIRQRFDNDVERFSNLETGQSATIDAPLVLDLITTVAAAESKEPSRAIVRMGTSITWRILLFYVASVFLIVCVVPWTEIVPGESPFTRSLVAMNFGWASTAMSVIILTAVLSCLNSAVYVSSRVGGQVDDVLVIGIKI